MAEAPADAVPAPIEFTARTLTVYAVPFEMSVPLAEVAEMVIGDAVVPADLHVEPLSVEYS